MKKLIAAGVAAAASVVVSAPAAHAAPFFCTGDPGIPATYVCVDRFNVEVDLVPSTLVHTPSICVAAFCVSAVDVTGPLPAAADEVVVVYYAGTCYYVHADGSVTTQAATSTSPPACP